jgi:hypothetical protein
VFSPGDFVVPFSRSRPNLSGIKCSGARSSADYGPIATETFDHEGLG